MNGVEGKEGRSMSGRCLQADSGVGGGGGKPGKKKERGLRGRGMGMGRKWRCI